MVFQAKKKDLTVVCGLAVKIWGGDEKMMEKEFAPRLANNKIGVLVAKVDNVPAGFIECSLREDGGKVTGNLEGVYVLPEFRGRGVARDLFDEAVKFVKKKGAVDVESGCPYCKKQLLLLNEKGKSEQNKRK